MRGHVPCVLLVLACAACERSDTIPVDRLAVVFVGPSPGAVGIGVDTDVRVTFSEVLRAETVNPGSICLAPSSDPADDCSGGVVPSQLGYDAASRSVTLVPLVVLDADREYAVRITGGVEGESGSLHSPIRTLFRTAP